MEEVSIIRRVSGISALSRYLKASQMMLVTSKGRLSRFDACS